MKQEKKASEMDFTAEQRTRDGWQLLLQHSNKHTNVHISIQRKSSNNALISKKLMTIKKKQEKGLLTLECYTTLQKNLELSYAYSRCSPYSNPTTTLVHPTIPRRNP